MSLELLYQRYFCEENIWQLARRADLLHPGSEVVFVSNATSEVACWNQRGGSKDEAVVWDYHVVLLEPGVPARIWDFDSTLRPSELGPGPIPARDWVRWTFLTPDYVREEFHPRFRVIPSADYAAHFASDRSHMYGSDGTFMQPPPPWAPPNAPGMNLDRYRDMTHLGPDAPPWGQVLDRAGFEAHIRQVEEMLQAVVLA